MNLLTLIKQYFSSKNEDLTIDVFDEKNIQVRSWYSNNSL